MSFDFQSFVKSRRFWLTFASIAVVVFKDKIPGLGEEQITAIVMAIGAWVVGESLRSSQAK